MPLLSKTSATDGTCIFGGSFPEMTYVLVVRQVGRNSAAAHHVTAFIPQGVHVASSIAGGRQARYIYVDGINHSEAYYPWRRLCSVFGAEEAAVSCGQLTRCVACESITSGVAAAWFRS